MARLCKTEKSFNKELRLLQEACTTTCSKPLAYKRKHILKCCKITWWSKRNGRLETVAETQALEHCLGNKATWGQVLKLPQK